MVCYLKEIPQKDDVQTKAPIGQWIQRRRHKNYGFPNQFLSKI